MKTGQVVALLLAVCVRLATAADANAILLAGQWRFALDRTDAGISEQWFAHALSDRIRLPGSLPEQGIGDDISTNTHWTGDIVDKSWFTDAEYAKYREPGNVKVPFWLQPEKYYVGAAWYQRDLEIPKAWAGKRVVLFLERPHWETRVWVDGRAMGTNDSLSTPHEYDLGQLTPGKHTVSIRVDNRMVVDIGADSHSVTDHTQGNWNGVVGRIELRATPLVWIEDLQMYPHAAARSVTVKGRVGKATGTSGPGELNLTIIPEFISVFKPSARNTTPIHWDEQGGTFQTEITMEADAIIPSWDEFSPRNVFRLFADVRGGESSHASLAFREISTDGTQFLINGRKTFFRGTLECCIFPKTGHPPTDIESWRRIIRVCKAHGLNLIRFHSWCPPEAAFQAADELGFYYQVEIASWANSTTSLGDGKPVDAWLYREAERILKAYGNHPSFVLMPYGNEPGGRNANKFLADWVNHWKATDPRRLYTSGSGWPQLAENQFHVTPDPRIQAWGAGLKSRINAKPPETVSDYRDYISRRTVPVISHEIGQWCVYPNFAEIPKYTGYLKPKNFEIFRDSLQAHGMGDQAKQFLLASGKLQTLCYKEDIESALRTPGMGGFELLDLHDFPGQGTALVGVVDPFWEDKGYVTAAEFSRFCNSTVPLVRLTKRVFTTDEKLEADLEVAHFGAEPMPEAVVGWKLVGDNGKFMTGGLIVGGTNRFMADLVRNPGPFLGFPGDGTIIPVGGGSAAGRLALDLQSVPAPAHYKLVVAVSRNLKAFNGEFYSGLSTAATAGQATAGLRLESHSRTIFENDWDIWVYPPQVDTAIPAGVAVVKELDAAAQRALDAGGKVLWLIPPKKVRNDSKAPVALGFSSIFWNTAWTRRQPPTTLGILCDPKHPLFAAFPTDFHSNWQWWYLVTRAGAMILDDLPRDLRPTVQVIDDWVTNRKLGLVFEARVGKGKLLVCSIDLEHDQDPVVRQFRASLLGYLNSGKFKPRVEVPLEQIRQLQQTP